MSKFSFPSSSFSATSTVLALGARAQFRPLLKLATGCRA